jgi:hypothetical protein
MTRLEIALTAVKGRRKRPDCPKCGGRLTLATDEVNSDFYGCEPCIKCLNCGHRIYANFKRVPGRESEPPQIKRTQKPSPSGEFVKVHFETIKRLRMEERLFWNEISERLLALAGRTYRPAQLRIRYMEAGGPTFGRKGRERQKGRVTK